MLRPSPILQVVSFLISSFSRSLLLFAMSMYVVPSGAQRTSAYDAELTHRIESSPRLPMTERHLGLHADIPGWAAGAVSGVAAGPDGRLYVIQRGSDADPILVFDQDGKLLRSWGRGDFTLPHSIRLDRRGNVWAIDAGASRIVEYTSTGTRLLTINIDPVPDTGSPFRGATDLAFAPNGDVLITDGYGNGRVLEYTTRGQRVREWGRPGTAAGQFHLPHAIQISPGGIIYVADRENGRIALFDPHGHPLRMFDRLGKCYALALRGGVLWVTMGPKDQDPGSPGWLVEMNAATGRILGHLSVPDQRAGHALDLLESGTVVETAGSGLLLFQTDERSLPRP